MPDGEKMFEKRPMLTEDERRRALDIAVEIVRGNLKLYTYSMQNHSSIGNIYPQCANDQWTCGFWPGEVWLSYEYTGNDVFMYAAKIMVDSFYRRIVDKVEVDHHDMGFLYTPSCVSAYKLTKDLKAREAALLAADQLISRFQEKGGFIQAWGKLGAEDNYRYIIDCLLNLPLLYWASAETGDGKYRDIALRHTATCLANSFRDDYSTYHTFFMDPKTGAPVRGETCQGYRADSSWARGQAWGVYGLALSYRNTGERKYLDLFEKVSGYFLSKLPEDMIPYWDLIFTEGDEPRDSSSASIVACGFLEAADSYEKLGEKDKAEEYRILARKLLKALYDTCMVENREDGIGLVLHGTYSKKSPYNTCTPEGVDECVSWGDYYWMEALMRLSGAWNCYWWA